MKKIISIILVFVLFANPLCAKDFKIDLDEKLSWVNIAYFEKFGDEHLTNYILKAIEYNNNARIASYRSEEFRQNVKYVFGGELPRASIGADYLSLKIPDVLDNGLNKNGLIVPLNASYELDLFQKNRDKTRSAQKDYEATKFDEKAAYISLASDVATAYTNILKFNETIEIQRGIVKAKKEVLKRTNEKFDTGVDNHISFNDASKDVEEADSDLDNLLINRKKLLYELAVMIGESPENINSLTFGKFENFGSNVIVPDEISSDVIFSRPDVLAVEKKLEKGKIDIRVARKEFLPRINIMGSLIFNTLIPGNFFNWDTMLGTILAGATQDIFKGGQKIATLKMKKMQYEEIFEEYKQIDLNALKEVNEALYILKRDTDISNRTFLRCAYEADNFSRNRKKYQNGLISYPELLRQNLTLWNIEQMYVDTKATQIIDNFTLYKAVGGKL